MFATGRRPATAGLGLEAVGVALDAKGAVAVDEFSTSIVPNIHAVGDVTNRIALTPVAIREGAALATTLFGGRRVAVDHRDVPHAVFSQPPIGTVGLSETAAVAAFGKVEVYATTFRPLKYTLSGRNERTLVKLVVDEASQRVVGAHMVGPDAPEIIQGTRDRGEGGAHQGAVRRDRGLASDRRRGVRDAARDAQGRFRKLKSVRRGTRLRGGRSHAVKLPAIE